MDSIEIRCPNCGSVAQRLLSDRLPAGYKYPALQVAQTECPVCDYFIAICWQNGAVLEAYAPGTQGNTWEIDRSLALTEFDLIGGLWVLMPVHPLRGDNQEKSWRSRIVFYPWDKPHTNGVGWESLPRQGW
jgi:hypothetical protein